MRIVKLSGQKSYTLIEVHSARRICLIAATSLLGLIYCTPRRPYEGRDIAFNYAGISQSEILGRYGYTARIARHE